MKKPYPQLEAQGITHKKVLWAIRHLPRELFVADNLQKEAYLNIPLPIDCGQTISQPFIVAYMTEKLEPKQTDKILEIGTGSGFQTGVLAQLARKVYTVEFYWELSQKAQKLLEKLGYKNVKYKIGDGKLGWPQLAPFDSIIITAATQKVPLSLLKQLKIGGKIILPLETNPGEEYLTLIFKLSESEIKLKKLIPVRFVPLV